MILLTIGFEHEGDAHKAIVRIKEKEVTTEYHTTIMNGKLEKLFYGNHIFVEENGKLLSDTFSDDGEVNNLRKNIKRALEDHLENSAALALMVD